MTGVVPTSGADFCIWRSTLASGRMTPLVRSSFSLRSPLCPDALSPGAAFCGGESLGRIADSGDAELQQSAAVTTPASIEIVAAFFMCTSLEIAPLKKRHKSQAVPAAG